MPSSYITSGEYASFGLPSTTTAAQVTQASVLIDTYLRRPEGLVYEIDTLGNPVFMKALPITGSFVISAGLAPGLNVVATVTGPMTTIKPGTVLIADKAIAAKMEPMVVVSVSGAQVTFKQVVYTHDADATYSDGLVILETKQMPSNRPIMMLSRNPVVRLVMGQGRYGYSRRGGSNNYTLNEYNLLAVMTQFGGPPIWENIDLSHTDFNQETGQVWLPAGIMLAYYSEARMCYLAGFTASSIPDIIKLAAANIINSQLASPLNGNLKLIKAGDTQMERFLDTVLDSDTRLMLKSYRARTYA